MTKVRTLHGRRITAQVHIHHVTRSKAQCTRPYWPTLREYRGDGYLLPARVVRTMEYGNSSRKYSSSGKLCRVGDADCVNCWSGFPELCANIMQREDMDVPCGGLVHATFFEEYWDYYVLSYLCDRCGATDSPS